MWTGGGGWVHSWGVVHMVAAGLGCRTALIGTGWANFCLGCTNGLRKCYSDFVGASFLAKKVVLAQNGSLLAENDDCCKFV